MGKSVSELHDLDAPGSIRILGKCKRNVFLVTHGGDRLDLRNKLFQLIGLTCLIEGGKIAEVLLECDDPEDESILFRYNLFQKP